MKTLAALLLLSVFFVACKKDRVCSCTVVTNGTTTTRASSTAAGIDTTIVTPLNSTNVVDATFYKVSKKSAKNNCFDKSESINESTPNGIPGLVSVTITNKGTRSYSCELK